MENTIAIPGVIKGRAIGALICGIFGSIWMFEALYFGTIATPVSLTVIALLAVTFIVWPVATLRSTRHLAGGQNWADVSKAYWTIVTVEWVSCIVGANVLSNTGHADLIPQFIGAIVGIHFLPLAKIFKAPIYNRTGMAMVLGVALSFAVPSGSLRNLVAYGICGLVLWATSTVILCKDKLSLAQ
jgi:hypothetical protein